jgi:Flp pilus assembly pilin Flp
MRVPRHFRRDESGGALAELAIMVPFLAIMMAGVVEFGRFFQTYTTLEKATRSAARYLSNHPYNSAEIARAKNLVVCGKLNCAGTPNLVKGFTAGNICIETTGSPKPETVTVRVPRNAGDCGDATPFVYQPIFDLGGLLGTGLSLALPLSPSSTMYYMVTS